MAYGKLTLNPGTDGKEIAIDTINGEDFQRIKQVYGGEGVATEAQQPLTDAQLTAQGLAKETTLELIRLLLAGTLTVNVGLTNAELRASAVAVSVANATGSAVTSVSISITNATVLALNVNRIGATFYNDGTADVYLKLGATASTTIFTVKIVPDGYYELPFRYSGIIDAITLSGSTNLRVTELT